MSVTDALSCVVWEDSGATFMARVLGNAGTAITQASITSITCKVFDLDSATPETAIATPTITVASVVYDTLQTSDPRWTTDSTGYNLLVAMVATTFPTGGHRYWVEFFFTPTSGAAFPVAFAPTARNLMGS